MKKIIFSFLLFFSAVPAFASGGNYTTSAFYRSSGSLLLSISSDHLGSSAAPIPKLWVQAFSATGLSTFVGGNIGIGTTSPGTLFGVHGAGLFSSHLTVGGTLTATSTVLLATTAGNVGIGSSSPSSVLSVRGAANATTTIEIGFTTAGFGSCIQWYIPSGASYREYVNNSGTKTLEAGTCK